MHLREAGAENSRPVELRDAVATFAQSGFPVRRAIDADPKSGWAVWSGKPFIQGKLDDRPRWGRDHHPYAFTTWFAGGGVKPGITYGASDDLGINAVENPVHVHDVQATIMHLLGIDHTRQTYRFQGRGFRLTDVHGNVVSGILA